MQYAEGLRSGYIELIDGHAWDWFATLTFADHLSSANADELFRALVKRINRAAFGRHFRKFDEGVSWFRVEELHKSRAIHYHALIGGVQDLDPYEFRNWWIAKGFGTAKITQFDPDKSAGEYLTKQLTDDGSNIAYHLDNTQSQFDLTELDFEACLVEREISEQLGIPFKDVDMALDLIQATAADREYIIDKAIDNVHGAIAQAAQN